MASVVQLFVAAVCFFAVTAVKGDETTTFSPEVKKNMENCNVTYPVAGDTLEYVFNNGVLLDQTVEIDRCFLECTIKGDVTDNNGKLNPIKARQNLKNKPVLWGKVEPTASRVNAAIRICFNPSVNKKISGKCVVGYQTWTCLHKQCHKE